MGQVGCVPRQVQGLQCSGLRLRCRSWAESGDHGRPADLYQWRNVALTMLRLDIDVVGLEQYDFENMPSALQRLKKEVEQMVSGMSDGVPQSGAKRLDLRARPRTAGD